MKTSSKKSKGRRLQNYVAQKLKDVFPQLDNDINPAVMGEQGTDIKLSPLAEKSIPFDIECKNSERLDLWGSLKQCECNAADGRTPLLIFKRNRSDVYCVLKLEDLMEVLWRT